MSSEIGLYKTEAYVDRIDLKIKREPAGDELEKKT